METEKIKTAEEIYEECIGSNSELGYIPTAKESVIEAINKFASQFKQPPVSVMPSEELYQALKNCVIELEQIRDGIAFTPSEGRISRAAEAIKKYELSLSKEAPKEENFDCLNKDKCVSVCQVCLNLAEDSSKETNKERIPDVGETIRETAIDLTEIAGKYTVEERIKLRAIEFAEWLDNNGWIRRPFAEESGEYLYDNHSLSSEEFTYDNPKTVYQLFDLFKQRK